MILGSALLLLLVGGGAYLGVVELTGSHARGPTVAVPSSSSFSTRLVQSPPASTAAPSTSLAPSSLPPATSAPGQPSAAGQAAAVDRLLGEAVNSRQQVVNAVQAVEQCPDPSSVSSAQGTLTQAAQEHQTLVVELGSLDVSQLPGGAAAQQTLSRAWSESAAADSAYASWAGAMANGGCAPGNAPHTADWDQAAIQSGRASADKQAFVAAWTPVAVQYHLPSRAADSI